MSAQIIIPHDVVEDILVRLPIKSLIRFKYVSKQLDRIFSDSNFIKTQKAKSPSPMSLFVCGVDVESLCALQIDFDTRKGTLRAPAPTASPFGPYDKVHIGIAHCNGLLCVLTRNGTVVVWNPTTNEYKRFHLPPIRGYRICIGLGLGYVSSTDERKVVVVISSGISDLNVPSKFYVLSLKTGMWNLNPNKRLCWIWRFVNQVAIAFDGCLYWICDDAIICFDLEQGDVMKDNETRGDYYGLLGIWGESLCLASFVTSRWYNVLVRKNERCRRILFRKPHTDNLPDDMSFLCFTGESKILIRNCLSRDLIVYDLKKCSTRKISIQNHDGKHSDWETITPYEVSLVRLI